MQNEVQLQSRGKSEEDADLVDPVQTSEVVRWLHQIAEILNLTLNQPLIC